MCILARFLRGAFELMLVLDDWRSRFDDVGRFSGSGVGNLIGDLLPFVCRGVSFLDVCAVDVEGDVVSDNVYEVSGSLS